MSNADKLAEALEDCLREHEGLLIKGGVESRARQALASYRASKDVADDELIGRLRDILEHYESVNQSYEANHTTEAHGDGVVKLDRPVFQDEEDALRQAIARLQAYINPVPRNELALELKLATINLTNPEDAGLLQLIEQVIVHLQAAPNPWTQLTPCSHQPHHKRKYNVD